MSIFDGEKPMVLWYGGIGLDVYLVTCFCNIVGGIMLMMDILKVSVLGGYVDMLMILIANLWDVLGITSVDVLDSLTAIGKLQELGLIVQLSLELG